MARRKDEFVPLGIAVLTVSDSRRADNDLSGDYLAGAVEEAGHRLAARALVADEAGRIRERVKGWIAGGGIDVVLTTGGTGLTGRDVTPEALRPLLTKHIEGFAALFHKVSFESIGLSTMLSRALGGVAGEVYVFALPGSPGACRDGWEKILRPQLDVRTRPCNLAEMLPRLSE